MLRIHGKKVVDKRGKEIAVQLDIQEFQELEEYFEYMEDSLELTEAIKSAEGFRRWEEFLEELKVKSKI